LLDLLLFLISFFPSSPLLLVIRFLKNLSFFKDARFLFCEQLQKISSDCYLAFGPAETKIPDESIVGDFETHDLFLIFNHKDPDVFDPQTSMFDIPDFEFSDHGSFLF